MDLRTAAVQLGVHYQTAYRWVRDGTLRATKVSGSYDITDEEIARVRVVRSSPVPPPRHTQVRSWDHQVDRLYAALADGDELGARAVVDRLHEGGVALIDLCEDLLGPALRRIGDSWAAGKLSVAEEHRSSAICERLLARIAEHPRGRPRGIAVVATPPGEQHALPSVMAAVVLRADRWTVHHVGSDVPDKDLLDLLGRVGASLLVLSVIQPDLVRTATTLARRAEQQGVTALVGGPAGSLRALLSDARAKRGAVSP